MLGNHGSADAIGTWLLLMLFGGLLATVPGLLAISGRWRSWHGEADSPIRYAPLAAIPFGIGCFLELGSTLVPPPPGLQAVVSGLLLLSALASCALFLRFPRLLLPTWVRRREDEKRKGPGLLDSEAPGPRREEFKS